MQDVLYEDDCFYLWGDPRIDDKQVPARFFLLPEGIKLVTQKDTVFWPKSGVRSAVYQPTHPVDVDEIAKQSIEVAEDILVHLAMNVPAEPAITLTVQDPEGVLKDGFEISLVFGKEYNARVAAKRIVDAYCPQLAPIDQ